MTRIETENALFTLTEAAAQFAKQYNPEINQISMYWLDGFINVTGMVTDNGEAKKILLSAAKFEDGTTNHDIIGLEKTA